MEFPLGFPSRFVPMAEAAILRVQRRLKKKSKISDQVIAAKTFAFAEVACLAAEAGEWPPDLALVGLRQFLLLLCHEPESTFVESEEAPDWAVKGPAERLEWMTEEKIERLVQEITESEKWLSYVERLAQVVKAQTKGAEPPAEPTKPATLAKARADFVLPLLETKGWSLEQWANEAEVSNHTASGYLAGKGTYRKTKLKLAEALGVPVNSLP